MNGTSLDLTLTYGWTF